MDLWVKEARLFKYGSGTGSNFSSVRGDGETLSGGGKSSGLMSSSNLKIFHHQIMFPHLLLLMKNYFQFQIHI